MSEYFPARITVGGKVSKEIVKKFNLQNGYLEDEMAENGEFDELEELLVENKIPFTRESEAYYEFPEEVVQYRPNMKEPVIITYINGQQVIPAHEISSMLNEMYQVSDFAQTIRNIIEFTREHYHLNGFEELPPFEEILE